MAGFDATVPHPARVYDFLLGGRDNFAADRDLAKQLTRLVPDIRRIVRENKGFLALAVTWVAKQGVDQFIDLGPGLPTSPATHEIARAANGRASVAYVDNDPVVVNHLIACSAKAPGVSVTEADFRDVDAVLATVDIGAPVCLIVGCVLHFFPASEAASLVARYTAALAPGSYLVLSVVRPVDQHGVQGQRIYTGAGMPHYTHSARQIAAFCAGLDLVPPGVADARCWSPEAADVPKAAPHVGGTVLVAVARRALRKLHWVLE